LVLVENLINEVLGVGESKGREAIWRTRDFETRAPTKRFLCSSDVKRKAYSLVVVGAGFGCTCSEFRIHLTGSDLGKEVEDDDAGMGEGRIEGFGDKKLGVLVDHIGGFCL